MSEKNKPVSKVRVGTVELAIWRTQSDRGPFYKASLSQSYRDASGTWHNDGNSYGKHDLINLLKTAALAHSEILKLTAQDRREQGETDGEDDEG